MNTRMIRTLLMLATTTIGTPLNFLLIFFIQKHTPSFMTVYSKILLQTCVTDLLLVLATFLIDIIGFATGNGPGYYLNGVLVWIFPNLPAQLGFSIWMVNLFLNYFSLYGFVSQFIFRYFTLMKIHFAEVFSTTKYFAMLAVIAIVPLIYVSSLGISCFPTEGYKPLKDQIVAEFLGINLSTETVQIINSCNRPFLLKLAFYYNVFTCTIAYTILIILGWKMYKFAWTNYKGVGAIGSQKFNHVVNVNKQLTRLLLIQVVLPFSVYVSLMFSMFYFLTDINFGLSPLGFVYINGFVTVTIYLPCAINPIVAIAIFNPYRQAFSAMLKNASCFKTNHPKITNK